MLGCLESGAGGRVLDVNLGLWIPEVSVWIESWPLTAWMAWVNA